MAKAEKAGREPLSAWLERELAKVVVSPPEVGRNYRDDSWEFDPDEHLAASEVLGVLDHFDHMADKEPFLSRAKEPLSGLRILSALTFWLWKGDGENFHCQFRAKCQRPFTGSY